MHAPKISIVTPNYNQSRFLEQTIQSVLNQNYPNLEYIIVDGGSNDGSVELIEKYEQHLTYWISEKDAGMYHAVQKGFERSSGEIMAWVNSDDMYHPGALSVVSEIFSTLPEVEWLTGYKTNYDEKGRTVNVCRADEHDFYNMFIHPTRHIQQESTFWRRSLWERTGGALNLDLKLAGDFELWMRFFSHGAKLYDVTALIGGFRTRDGQLSQSFRKEYHRECTHIIDRYREQLSFYDRCALREAEQLQKQLEHVGDTRKKRGLSAQLTAISQKPGSLVYDHSNQQFHIQGDDMTPKGLVKKIYTRRDDLRAFATYLKQEHHYYPEAVIDVGVAYGTPELYETFPRSKIVLVEPLAEFQESLQKIARTYHNVVIESVAAGASDGDIAIHVHSDLVGSSLYRENEGADIDGEERVVPMLTLDSIIRRHVASSASILLKIDVQGAELRVLEGSKTALSQVDVIVLEVSLHRFYEHGHDLADIIATMKTWGYVAYDIFGFLNRPYDSSLAQVDIAFVKENGRFKQTNKFASRQQREILNHILVQNSTVEHENEAQSKIAFSQQYNKLFSFIEYLGKTDERYVIYGFGTIGRTVGSLLSSKIVAYVDQNHETLRNETGEKVFAPDQLPALDFDKIIISVLGREKSILHDLSCRFGIDEERCIVLELE